MFSFGACIILFEIYSLFLHHLKQTMFKKQFEFQLKIVTSDFEAAIIQAFELESPETEIAGSYFHFCQCKKYYENYTVKVAKLRLEKHIQNEQRSL